MSIIMMLLPISLRVIAILALVAVAACGDAEPRRAERTSSLAVGGFQPGVTLEQYAALPDSVRLAPGEDDSRGQMQGVTVSVNLRLDGQRGASVPLDYTLHDARNGLAFVSRRIPMKPDADAWSRSGKVWLPVPSPGTYYVQVVLGDSTGRTVEGPRTEPFTIR